MVAGARLAIEAGWEVRGSDNPLYPPTSFMVEALGAPVAQGYSESNLDWTPDLTVIGNALSRGNPEVEAILERGLHYVSLAEWLKDVVLRPRKPIVICGTHGKTTTTALAAFLLEEANLNAGYLIGGQPLNFPHSARLGAADAPFVIEGDEYDTAFFDKRAKFFHYLPQIAVVTSLEFDHGDIYRDVEEIEKAFRLMLRQIPRTGHLVVCADNPRAAALREHAFCPVLSYGLSETADFRGILGNASSGLQRLDVFDQGVKWGEFQTPLAGRHNVQNTLAALAVGRLLGIAPETLASALPRFHSVRRRMEVFLEANGITFVDDFAHHPTAIAETAKAARGRWPEGRLWLLLEPRSNTLVTNAFQNELANALRVADCVWIGPIYRADRMAEDTLLDRAGLVKILEAHGVHAHCTDQVPAIVDDVREKARPGDVVLICSNGAFEGIYARFRKAYASR